MCKFSKINSYMTIILFGLGLVGFMGCTPAFEGEYADPSKGEIVDDKWNETDARQTAQVMIKTMLERNWLKKNMLME